MERYTKVYKINSQEDYEKIKIVDNEFELFQGIDIDSIPAALICLGATTKNYKKEFY